MTAEPLERWLAIEPDGSVVLRTGKVELGQGAHTALRSVVAEELDVAVERVRVQPVDTDLSPDEGLTAGSRSMEEAGSAFRTIAASARARLIAAAAVRLEADPAEGPIEGRPPPGFY